MLKIFKEQENKDSFSILSLDEGGVRGVRLLEANVFVRTDIGE
jgi:patatin-like phospholipase/acyl hydrolase